MSHFQQIKLFFFGSKIASKKIREINTIPEKKNNENKKFLIMLIKN